MLISTYLFMRYAMPCPEYSSRDEYYSAASRGKIPTKRDFFLLPADPEFRKFLRYYLSLCSGKGLRFSIEMENAEDDPYVCYLAGQLTGERNDTFRQDIECFFKKYGDVRVIFDCSTLTWIDMEGIRVFADLKTSGRRFVLKNLNADCTVLFSVEGFEAYLEENDRLPEIDLSRCEKLNEGANGVIYRVSDELAAKTFKDKPDYFDIVSRRIALKNALICGIPAPLSFGYAVFDGKIVTLMELIHARSLMQIIASEENSDAYIIRYAQFVRQLHEIRDENKLEKFMRDMFGREILCKADRCDCVLQEEYRGRAREIIEAVDEPECLVHGDIQPNNIMVSGDEMLFIDFDSFSTGKAVYDLGGLYRTLLCNADKGSSDINSFLGLPVEKCRGIWEMFTAEYYKDEQEEVIRKKVFQAKLIGTVLALAKLIKNEADPGLVSRWASELERLTETQAQ